jgi:hypothetical protein
VLAGKPSPLAGEIEGKIHLVLCHQIEKYKWDDPSTKRKIALPYTAIKYRCQTRLKGGKYRSTGRVQLVELNNGAKARACTSVHRNTSKQPNSMKGI